MSEEREDPSVEYRCDPNSLYWYYRERVKEAKWVGPFMTRKGAVRSSLGLADIQNYD